MDINTDPCRCVVTESDMAFSSTLGFTIAPGGRAGHSQKTTPLYPQASGLVWFVCCGCEVCISLSILLCVDTDADMHVYVPVQVQDWFLESSFIAFYFIHQSRSLN